LASHHATLGDFMALSYDPVRALALDRLHGSREWVDCGDRYGRIYFWCAVTPTSARRHCEQYLCKVPTLSKRRGKNIKSPEKN
jgi:hypothetical protein